ncbi:GGDEF domain-containing protein [Burkholderia sp. Bp9125]|nr:GGDEF domain-containing protein [Burkholderia sp. Bp9125]
MGNRGGEYRFKVLRLRWLSAAGAVLGLSVGKDGTISVLETNGALITRLPYDANRVGQNVGHSPIFERIAHSAAGAFVGTSVLDGVRRLFVYQHVPGVPIIVDVAPAIDEVFSDWRLRAKWLASLMVLFTLAIIIGTRVLLRELKRRRRAEAQLQRMAHRDAMTGLHNRGTFDAVWTREWRRASRSGKPLSLLFIDIDCFKAYNDHYGHQAGDQVLKAVAQRIASCAARATDHVARYGGEEFVVVHGGVQREVRRQEPRVRIRRGARSGFRLNAAAHSASSSAPQSSPAAVSPSPRLRENPLSCSGGCGRASRNPCAWWQPISCTNASCCSVSTPSMITSSPSARPIATIARTIGPSAPSAPQSARNDRSIFSVSTGRSFRYTSDE